jgi:hypothetical protein
MFEKEVSLIESEIVRDIVKQGISLLPDFFFSLPASSSGKYHPNYALGDGGLYRHVQAAVIIAEELFRMEEYDFSPIEKDEIRAALILHDGMKQGRERNGHTLFEHPRLMALELRHSVELQDDSWSPIFNNILDSIESHMGQWNTDKYSGKPELPRPITKMQKFVHLCDYLASRKQLEVNFNSR